MEIKTGSKKRQTALKRDCESEFVERFKARKITFRCRSRQHVPFEKRKMSQYQVPMMSSYRKTINLNAPFRPERPLKWIIHLFVGKTTSCETSTM